MFSEHTDAVAIENSFAGCKKYQHSCVQLCQNICKAGVVERLWIWLHVIFLICFAPQQQPCDLLNPENSRVHILVVCQRQLSQNQRCQLDVR
jgi:hypothetical protein